MYSNDMEELESKTFWYFLDELEYFIGDKDYDSFEETLDDFCNNGNLTSTLRRNFYVDDFFKPEFGITLKTLLSILQENGCTFKDYIKNILVKNNAEKELVNDGFTFGKLDFKDIKGDSMNEIREGLFGGSDNDTITDDSVKAAKELLIKQGTGIEDLNLDNLDNDDLDKLLVKTAKVTEKVDIIKEAMKGCDKEDIAEVIAKHLNMHKKEALSIL